MGMTMRTTMARVMARVMTRISLTCCFDRCRRNRFILTEQEVWVLIRADGAATATLQEGLGGCGLPVSNMSESVQSAILSRAA